MYICMYVYMYVCRLFRLENECASVRKYIYPCRVGHALVIVETSPCSYQGEDGGGSGNHHTGLAI